MKKLVRQPCKEEEVETEAAEALFVEDLKILCLDEIPNFILRGDFLSEDPGKTSTLYACS